MSPLNYSVKQNEAFRIIGFKKLVMQRNTNRVEAALLNEMNVRLGDVTFAIGVPELVGSLRSDKFRNQSFNLARRFRAAIIQVPHVAFGHKPIA
jgi:hypothetical protein